MKKYILTVVLLLVGLLGLFWYFNMSGVNTVTEDDNVLTVSMPAAATTTEMTNPLNNSENQNTKDDTVINEKVFTLAEVQAKNSKEGCYSAINGNVYNLTAWIDKHPGGSIAIMFICGKDGTKGFLGKHTSSDKAKAALARYKIGVLAQ